MVRNLRHDKISDCLEWIYQDKTFKIFKKYIYTYTVQNDLIYFQCGENFVANSVFYYNLNGVLHFGYDIKNNLIFWSKNNQSFEKKCYKLMHANLYEDQNILVILHSSIDNSKCIEVIDLEGEKLFQIKETEDLNFRYLSKVNNMASIVIENVKEIDKYGRTEFHYIINLLDQKLLKSNLAH